MAVSAVLIILAAAVSADAKTLYVDRANGNDAVSYAANGPSAPWATLGRAAWGSTNRNAPNPNEAARAGDTVMVAAGTYSSPGSNGRFDPAFNPANSGTSSNPIVFQAQGTVNLTLSSGVGPVIGAEQRNYITWRGFTINEATAPPTPDTGVVTVHSSTGTTIEGCTIIGNPSRQWDDNHTGIRTEHAPFTTIRNNRISDIYNTGVLSNQENGACIQSYFNGSGLLIENNEVSNCGAGIALKAIQPNMTAPATVRYNLIHHTESGIVYHIVLATASSPTRIYQNIIRDGQMARYGGGTPVGIKIRHFTGADQGPLHGKFVNNTIDNVQVGLLFLNEPMGNNGNMFWNNVITNTSTAIMNEGSASNVNAAQMDFEHNLYFGFGTFALSSGANYNFTNWRTAFSQDSASPASATADPMYVNRQGGDFRLQASSPARSGGVDYLDLNRNGSTGDTVPRGAYVTGNEVIGLTSGGGSNPSAPSAPSNLRIITSGE